MRMTGNTILITGGGSGIERGLAEAFHARKNQVIISGRRQDMLDRTTAANPGMQGVALDIDSGEAIQHFAERMKREYPALNVVIYNAGIMRTEAVREGGVADAEAMITTNLLGPIRLTAALLPLLIGQPNACLMTVSSGLAFVPLALNPTYSATKAAIHSYTESLRYQLQGTGVQVMELIPPYVQTELTGERQANDPAAMPLADFLAETLEILENSPNANEICVERVKVLRFAQQNGSYDAFYAKFNDAMVAARTKH